MCLDDIKQKKTLLIKKMGFSYEIVSENNETIKYKNYSNYQMSPNIYCIRELNKVHILLHRTISIQYIHNALIYPSLNLCIILIN